LGLASQFSTLERLPARGGLLTITEQSPVLVKSQGHRRQEPYAQLSTSWKAHRRSGIIFPRPALYGNRYEKG
jgi:hypothetical protein